MLRCCDALQRDPATSHAANTLRELCERHVQDPIVELKELSERDTVVKKVSIVPLEVIIRNLSAGSFAKRYGVEEGIVFDAPTIEFSYKNDDLGDPLMNAYHAVALKVATWEEIDLIKNYAFRINTLLKGFLKSVGIDLVAMSVNAALQPDYDPLSLLAAAL